MDYIRIIRSLEEFLYEVVTWFVFYPRTIGRIVLQPARAMAFCEAEQAAPEPQRYEDAISPPLLLMLTVLVVHGLELVAGVKLPEGTTALTRPLFASDWNTVLFRSVAFSIFPLVMATSVARRRGLGLRRSTLRGPFAAQCYLAAPFALGISGASVLARMPSSTARYAGAALALVTTAWYLLAETACLRRQLEVGPGSAFMGACWGFARALGCMFVLALAVTVAL